MSENSVVIIMQLTELSLKLCRHVVCPVVLKICRSFDVNKLCHWVEWEIMSYMAFVVSELLKIKGTNLLIRFAPLQFNCIYFNSIYNRCQQIRYIFFRFVYSYNMKYNRRIFLVILSYLVIFRYKEVITLIKNHY